MMMKSLAAGLLSVAVLATPAAAQVLVQEPGVAAYTYPGAAYGPRYYRNIPPGPPVGAFATAPWDDGSYGYSYGYGYAPY